MEYDNSGAKIILVLHNICRKYLKMAYKLHLKV